METEVCQNCGRTIGNLETRHLFNGQIVCPGCDEKLRSPSSPGPSRQNIDVNAPEAKRLNPFGVVSIVLGIIASLSCWIPFVGCLVIPIGLLGVLFGLIGALFSLVTGRWGAGFPFAGTVVCLIAVYVAFVSTKATIGTFDTIVDIANTQRTIAREGQPASEGETVPNPLTIDVVSTHHYIDMLGVKVEITNISSRHINSCEATCILKDAQGEKLTFQKHHVIKSNAGLRPGTSTYFNYIINVQPKLVKGISFHIEDIDW